MSDYNNEWIIREDPEETATAELEDLFLDVTCTLICESGLDDDDKDRLYGETILFFMDVERGPEMLASMVRYKDQLKLKIKELKYELA